MTGSPDRKRRHHYVWQQYLRAWSLDGAVVCLREGAIFSTGTPVVAVETDFYQMKELNREEIAFIQSTYTQHPSPLLRKLNEGWLRAFLGPTAIRDLKQAGASLSDRLARELRDAASNSQEDLHAAIERRGAPYLVQLSSGDLSFLRHYDDRATFLHFLCVQYFRTAKLRSDVAKALAGATTIRARNVWDPMCHILATSLTYGLLERWPSTLVELLRTDESAEFVTSDQPVINLHTVHQPEGTLVEKLCFHWPITPTLALRWDAEHGASKVGTREVDAITVASLNCSMRALAHEWVFGRTAGPLQALSAC
jgi:hypothetical protein